MNTPPETNPSPAPTPFWQRIRAKEISYLTIPLLVMATIVEFVILVTGFRYQRAVCVPEGMLVTFFGIGPFGAAILSVELLKLPLAIWTASRRGWWKAFMLVIGLPLICVLTFQLVKDMAVYEMGTAMKPASVLLEKATTEETKIERLNAELENQTKDNDSVKAFVDSKKAERDRKLAELSAKLDKAKADIEESLKRNDASRNDAITLTDYQKKELAEVEQRQARLIQQSNADTEQLTKSIAELRTRREIELARATNWNAEEARIENAYKARMTYYTNRKNAYEKDKAEYDKANFLERQVMKEPVDPGVPPERETNKILKPTLVGELESQIKAKEAELVAVSNKRRDGVAQIEADARRIREDFDRRSGNKREETDRKREELLAAMSTLVKDTAAEARNIEQEFDAAVAKERAVLNSRRPLDTVRNELADSRKLAERYYEEREAAIRATQVHRIATTVEIVRGLIFGERPMSVTASAKERGNILTDQISMVRIWVYPVLAFIVAFLPTLMVEIGFSTLFREERRQPPHRLGLFGRGLHRLYIRAGRQKILHAERLAAEAAAELAQRERAAAAAKSAADAAYAAKVNELLSVQKTLAGADAKKAEEIKEKETVWNARLSAMSDSLNRAVLEKDELRDLQKDEVERQIRSRQDAWLERVNQLRAELESERAAAEAERTALIREHHEKLKAVTEEAKTQLLQARREAADAELAAVERSAKIAHDLKEALHARQAAEAQSKHQADTLAIRLAQAREEAARDLDKATREAAHRAEHLQLDFANTLRQREDDFGHRLRQREQELTLAAEAAATEERKKAEQETRRREAELERRFEVRAREVEARWNQQVRQLEEGAEARLKQREQQLQAQTAVAVGEKQTQAELESRRLEAEFKHRLESQSREAEARLREELQKQELGFLARIKQQEQDLVSRVDARDAEAQIRRAAELRAREEEWDRQADARARAVETRLAQEAQQKEEAFNQKLRQREQQLLAQADAREAEFQARLAAELRSREEEAERQADSRTRALETRLALEAKQKEDAFSQKLRQREQQLLAQADAREAEAQVRLAAELRARDEEGIRQADSRVRALETRFALEAQQKEELFNQKLRQREQQLLAQSDTRQAEILALGEQESRRREQDAAKREQQFSAQIEALRADAQAQVEQESRRREQDVARMKQREQELTAQLNALAESNKAAERKAEIELQSVRGNADALRARTEKERDEAVKLRQRDQQSLAQAETRQAELLARIDEETRRREQDVARLKQRESELIAQAGVLAEANKAAERRWEAEVQSVRAEAEARLAQAEKERDEARKIASDGVRQVQSLEEKLMEFSKMFSNWKGGLGK